MIIDALHPSELTARQAESFLAGLASTAAGQAIDLSDVQSFDSAGLAALVKIAATRPLLHAPEKLRKLAALYGLDRIFS